VQPVLSLLLSYRNDRRFFADAGILWFFLGALFLGLIKHCPIINFKVMKELNHGNETLLVLAITLHNILEGLAVGVLLVEWQLVPEASIAGAITLAIGIGIQNFPEGIAVAMPLRRMGMSRSKSFMYGQGSALVEPVAAVLGAL
jgi:ZIP family zinc transporter